jgi:hypothetical protein
VGVHNQFRLRSLLGARIPLNATYSPLIFMYNPFNASLQVRQLEGVDGVAGEGVYQFLWPRSVCWWLEGAVS